MKTAPALGPDDLPAVFRAADQATAAAQRQVVRRTQLQIAALIGVAAVGALGSFRPKSGSSWAGLVGEDATWIGIAAAGLLLGGAFIRLQGLGRLVFEAAGFFSALLLAAEVIAFNLLGLVPTVAR